MSRKPKIVLFHHRKTLAPLMADIRRYASDPTLPDRDMLLIQSGMHVSQFIEELMNDAAQTALLLETLRVLRESTGPGTSSAEEEIMRQLHSVALSCIHWLEDDGMTRETCRTTELQSSDSGLQPLCDVLKLLVAYSHECFEYCRPRDSFAGQRRSEAFEIFGVVGALLDFPDVVELARKAIKKGRADARGAMIFLDEYLKMRDEPINDDLENALLTFAKRTRSCSLAVGALKILVDAGSISDFEACERIDAWKTAHWGGR